MSDASHLDCAGFVGGLRGGGGECSYRELVHVSDRKSLFCSLNPKNGIKVGAAISITIGGCGLCRWKRSLFQLTQRVSLSPPPRSDLLIGNAFPGAIGASSRCGVPLIPRLRRGATLYLAPTGLRWFLISSSGVARGCHEVPRWGTGTPPFPQQLSCKVRPNACGSQWPFPFLGLAVTRMRFKIARPGAGGNSPAGNLPRRIQRRSSPAFRCSPR